MGARGPKKGQGGRPRKPKGQHAANSEGYARITTGSKKSPKRVYEHRMDMPKATKGSKSVVDHKDGNKMNNSKSNLRMMPRGKNAHRSK